MEDKKPLLSICIPTYNRAEKLKYCLQAIYDACDDIENDKYEIIISDNASEDNTKFIVNSFQLKGMDISYNRNIKNLGFNKNWALLLSKYANGEYCWCIGDDDFIDKDSLKYLIKLLEKNYDLLFI